MGRFERRTRRLRAALSVALPSTAAVFAVVRLSHGSGSTAAVVLHFLQLLPVAVIGVMIADALVGRLSRWLSADTFTSAAGAVVARALAVTVPFTVGAYLVSEPPGGGHVHAAAGTGGAGARLQHALGEGTTTLAVAAVVLAAAAIMTAVARQGAIAGQSWRARTVTGSRSRRPLVSVANLATATAMSVSLLVVSVPFARSATAVGSAQAVAPCDSDSAVRSYDVVAINVVIPRNRWGDADRQGMIYALRGDVEALKNWDRPLAADPADDPAGNRRLRPRPLVLRANEGECMAVSLENELTGVQAVGIPQRPRVSMHIFGVAFDPSSSDGTLTGFNPDLSIGVGESRTYYWRAPRNEGLYMFRDLGVSGGDEADAGSAGRGLFGALAVEPAGATYRDPETGAGLYTGTGEQSGELYVDAIIDLPDGAQFRETVQLGQDELPEDQGFAFNYGAEPQSNRDAHRCPDCVGEETSLSSWPYGDPALVKLASGPGPWLPPGSALETPPPAPLGTPPPVDTPAPPQPDTTGSGPVETPATPAVTAAVAGPLGPAAPKPPVLPRDPALPDQEDCGLPSGCWTSNVAHAYLNDNFKIRFGMAGSYETHVFHLHANTWLADPADVGKAGTYPTRPSDTNRPQSTTIDSQTFGPWEAFTADLLFGAGSKAGTVGDSIFHCHLYPHFAAGFWGLLRTHDVLEDGSGFTPDGIRVRRIVPLESRPQPPAPTEANPGFPRFMPGETGWRAPQPPLTITDGPGGPPSPRMVAGRYLSEADTEVERSAMTVIQGGRTPVPGAPLRDPCPEGARQVTYNVSAIQTDVVYNSQGWHDPQSRILVLDSDVEAVRSGRKAPEPFYFRANAGDCINFRLTNLLPSWLGGDAFQELVNTTMVGQHIHLVKFDVTASDGSTNGWNYQQAAFSGGQRDFDARVAAGDTPCNAISGCRMAPPQNWDPNRAPPEQGQTYNARWYADYELRTVFTHDHHFAAVAQQHGLFAALVVEPAGFDVRDPASGRYSQPINQPAHGPVCSGGCEATAVGTVKDLIGPAPNDDFREFGVAVQDYVSLTRAGGDVRSQLDTIASPLIPERIPANDPGTMAVNYRNEPLAERLTLNGQPANPADWFSSHVWGDPATPIFKAYTRDRIQFRLMQGAQEEQHNFEVHGLRWAQEPDDPESAIVSTQSIGISEAFNLQVPDLSTACRTQKTDCQADFLYGGVNLEDRYMGAWGLLRAFAGSVYGLLPLPDNVPPDQLGPGEVRAAPATESAIRPESREHSGPGEICPDTAPEREFDIVAMERPISYDGAGDNDPYGLTYVLADEVDQLASKRPEPLVIRANVGDCIKVRLTNNLTPRFLEHTGIADGDAPVGTEPAVPMAPAGLDVSLHPQLLRYDVRSDDGANVGMNLRQTAAPGETVSYEWYADQLPIGEQGVIPLTDFGDFRGHRHHGLTAALVIEPRGATFTDPFTGLPVSSGPAADINVADQPSFREQVLVLGDGLTLRRGDGSQIFDGAAMDQEDLGEVSINYGTEPFWNRLGQHTFGDGGLLPPTGEDAGPHTIAPPVDGDLLASVRRSAVHGDPSTPIIRAYTGDAVRIRIVGSDRGRQQVFHLAGHDWRNNPHDPGSRNVGVQGGITAGSALNIHVTAGSTVGGSGDYLYGGLGGKESLTAGLWGIFRVYPTPADSDAMSPTPLGAIDDPYSGVHPLIPLRQLPPPPPPPDPLPAPAPGPLPAPDPAPAPDPFIAPAPAPTPDTAPRSQPGPAPAPTPAPAPERRGVEVLSDSTGRGASRGPVPAALRAESAQRSAAEAAYRSPLADAARAVAPGAPAPAGTGAASPDRVTPVTSAAAPAAPATPASPELRSASDSGSSAFRGIDAVAFLLVLFIGLSRTPARITRSVRARVSRGRNRIR